MPRLDPRLSMLFSITTLVIADLVDEEESVPIDETKCVPTNHQSNKNILGKRRNDLVSSLQVLGDYQGLLTPPRSIVSAANQAAAKAMLFVSGINVGSAYFECINMKDMPVNCCKLYAVLINHGLHARHHNPFLSMLLY